MAEVGFSRSIRDLHLATDLAQLRDRLSDCLADLGFWGVGQSINPLQIEDHADYKILRYIWDNFESRVGARRPELVRALHNASMRPSLAEENFRLEWLARQKSPYLAIGDAPVRFEPHYHRCQLVRDFGLRAVDLLVVPISVDREGASRIWTMAEAPGALANREAAAGLLAVYTYMSRMIALEGRSDRKAGNSAQLTDKEREVLRWAAAGKTFQEIAAITGLPYRTVRFHIDSARNRYGFATTQQTIVRAALDYDFDPLGPGQDPKG